MHKTTRRDVRIVVIVAEHVTEFVHHGGQQVHAIRRGRAGQRHQITIVQRMELVIVPGRGVDKPAVAGRVGVDQHAVATGESQQVAREVGDDHIHTREQAGVDSCIGPPGGRFLNDGSQVGVGDRCRFCAGRSAEVASVAVSEIMTRNPVTAPPACSVEEAMTLMTERRFRHLPIVEDGKTLGLVSIGDLVKARLEDVTVEIEYLRDFIRA